MILEGAQSGLSWITILRKREGYRRAFANIDPKKVAKYDEKKVNELLEDASIVRNRLEDHVMHHECTAFFEYSRGIGSFDNYIWGFCGWLGDSACA